MNLELLSAGKRLQIEIDRQASLLVYKLRNKKIKRNDVSREINNSKNSELLRQAINKYLAK